MVKTRTPIASAIAVKSAALEDALAKTILAIPSVNGGSLLRRMFRTLNVPPHIVYVLDQNSNDDTEQVCAEFGANIIQLGDPKTYTTCCNIALREAEKQGCEFLFISNNDITFTTDVARELLDEIIRDPNLGILSCSQVVTDTNRTNPILSNRVSWNLADNVFEHDLDVLSSEFHRIESDFCELTFAVVRVAAAQKVGGLDDKFGFYHEDADLGFRLREAGYTCAYLPGSQIEHYQGSTFNRGLSDERRSYIEKSKALFAKKHCGFGVSYPRLHSDVPSSWTIINRYLHPNLSKIGMIDDMRPVLSFSHPGERPFDYLYTVWETSKLPDRWLDYVDSYKCVLLPCQWNLAAFEAAGFANCHYVPLGVDTDVFHTQVASIRPFDEPTFLWFSRNQHRKGLDVMLNAWAIFRIMRHDAKLIVMGHGILTEFDVPRTSMRLYSNYLIYDDLDNNITYMEIVKPLNDKQVAKIYSSVDCVVVTSRSEGFGFNVVESLACGTMVVFPDYGSTKDMSFEGALQFSGDATLADYSDKGFYDVGDWWEPRVENVVQAMVRAINLEPIERATLVRRGLNLIRSKFTWRTSAFALRSAVKVGQIQRPQSRVSRENHSHVSPSDWLLESFSYADVSIDPVSSLLDMNIDEIFDGFEEDRYFACNVDLRRTEVDGLWHFILFGFDESRNVSKDTSSRQFLAARSLARSFLIYFNGILSPERHKALNLKFTKWEFDRIMSRSESMNLSNYAFIRLIYRIVLRRDPDHEGLQHYLSSLFTHAASREQILISIANSDEARALRGDNDA